MAFVTEDGTGIANANSYVSVADADDYFATRAVAAWADLDDANKQAALIRGSEFVDEQYGSRFIGLPLYATQALQWPRTMPQVFEYYVGEVWATEYWATSSIQAFPVGIPPQVKRAVLELAVIAAQADLYAQPIPSRTVTQELNVIGPITTSTSYAVQPLLPSSFQVRADKIVSILGPLLDGNAMGVNLPVGRM